MLFVGTLATLSASKADAVDPSAHVDERIIHAIGIFFKNIRAEVAHGELALS
jgi:hypothetical protein